MFRYRLLLMLFVGFWTADCGDIKPEEGQFECEADSDCPPGWFCNLTGDGHCYSDNSRFGEPGVDTNRDAGSGRDADTEIAPDLDSGTGAKGDTGADRF